jgi:hypothetical protein
MSAAASSTICRTNVLNNDIDYAYYTFPGAGITTGYGLDDWGVGVRVPLGSRIFSMSSRPALGPTQPFIQWVPRDSFPGVKRSGREANQSPPSNVEVKKTWICTSTPPHVAVLNGKVASKYRAKCIECSQRRLKERSVAFLIKMSPAVNRLEFTPNYNVGEVAAQSRRNELLHIKHDWMDVLRIAR